MADKRVNKLKIALPKGRLLKETAKLLKAADWGISGYTEGARSYRPESKKFPDLLAKIFHERDIPIQVAVGNYDIGICGLDWIEELLVKYPSSPLVKLRNLRYGEGVLYAVVSGSETDPAMETIRAESGIIRIVSEYPNLAESFALRNRLKRFSIFPLWGGAEVYPPESAELALIAGGEGAASFNHDLVPVRKVLGFNACLIANRNSWEREDLSGILASLDRKLTDIGEEPSQEIVEQKLQVSEKYSAPGEAGGIIRLALPDGHQQKPTVVLLNRAGVRIDDYPSETGNRRPNIGLEGVSVKVIRPQDMPLQVANGNFDLAITGKDWLTEHLYQFPSSPVAELLDLKFARVRVVVVVSNDLAVEDIGGLRELYEEHSMTVRVASEYVNIADKCARDNRLGVYKVIPTWGATEAFLPEDADVLIENTETGSTIARHNLKIIDNLFESTGRLIGSKESISGPEKGDRIKSIIEMLKTGVGDK
jgi:ATP phosphoribosyltransferase